MQQNETHHSTDRSQVVYKVGANDMKIGRKYFEILGELDRATPDDYEARQIWMSVYMRIRRLAKKHHRLAEYDCNGEGVIRGRFYRCDGSTPGAYLPDEETTIFSAESDKVEEKIKKLCDKIGIRVEFQGDPRGATVQLYANNRYIPIID